MKSRVLLAFLMCVFLGSMTSLIADYKSNVTKGNELTKKGKYKAALVYYKKAYKEKPNKKLAAHIKKLEARVKKRPKKKKSKPRAAAKRAARTKGRISSYNSSGLHGLIFMEDTTISPRGKFHFAPCLVYEYAMSEEEVNEPLNVAMGVTIASKTTTEMSAGFLRVNLNGNYGIKEDSEIAFSIPINNVSMSSDVTSSTTITYDPSWGLPSEELSTVVSRSAGETGLGDIRLSGKMRFVEQVAGKPSFAGVVHLDLPTGDASKGLGQGVDIFVGGVAGFDKEKMDFYVEIGLVIAGDYEIENEDGKKIAEWERGNYTFLGLGVVWPAKPRWDLFGELYINGYEAAGEKKRDRGSLLNLGSAFQMSDNLNFKIGGLLGLDEQTPDIGGVISCTYK